MVFVTPPTYWKQSATGTCQIVSNVVPPSVPNTASAIIVNIHTYSSASDHVVHSFGRNASHSCASFQANLFSNNAYYNDLLLSHNGNLGSSYAQGHAHGTHVIPLKSNGTFDTQLNMGHVTGTHYVSMQIIGYTTGNGSFFASTAITHHT